MAFVLVASGSVASPPNAPKVDPDVDAAIGRLLSRFDSGRSPGCALGVVKDEKLVFARGYGLADVEKGVPITPSTPFRLASESKQFLAAAVLIAGESGALSLDDDLRDHIPEYPAYGRPILLRHLLHHTSGIRDYGTLWIMRGESAGMHAPAETLDLLIRQRGLNFPPGDFHLYSNSGYFLLGIVLERATGLSLAAYARRQIFEPLGMRSTGFAGDSALRAIPKPVGHVGLPGRGFSAVRREETHVGPSGVVTTLEDLARWERAFHGGRIAGFDLVARMMETGRLNSGEELAYAAGLVVGDFDGTLTVSHGGEGGGHGAIILRYPEVRMSVMCICNHASSGAAGLAWQSAIALRYGPFRRDFDSVQDSVPDPVYTRMAPGVLKELAGAYRDPHTRAVWRASALPDALLLDSGTGTSQFKALGMGHFRRVGRGERIELRFADDRMVVKVENKPASTFGRVRLVTPDAVALKAYSGTYWSDELGVPWIIEVRGGRLHFGGEGAPAEPLTPTVRDEFSWGPELRISFDRNDDGRVTAMSAHTERVWGIAFDRRASDAKPDGVP